MFPTAVDRPFMQLLDMEFYDFERFSKEYSSQATAFWQDRGGKFGVVSTYVTSAAVIDIRDSFTVVIIPLTPELRNLGYENYPLECGLQP